MRHIIFFGFFIILLLQGCSNSNTSGTNEINPNSVNVKITFAAGQSLPMDSNRGFLSLPFNIGVDAEFVKHSFVIIADEIKESSTIDVIPIGIIKIDNEGLLEEYIISVPAKDSKRTIPTTNFYEFSTVYSGAKWIIEQYFINYKGLGKVKLISWENEIFAQKRLKSDQR